MKKSKYAHSKLIRYSDRYCEKWTGAQHHTREKHGSQGGGFKGILTNASYAPQRKLTEGPVFQSGCVTLIASGATVSDDSCHGPDKISKEKAK